MRCEYCEHPSGDEETFVCAECSKNLFVDREHGELIAERDLWKDRFTRLYGLVQHGVAYDNFKMIKDYFGEYKGMIEQ